MISPLKTDSNTDDAAKSDLPMTTPEFNLCMTRFYAKLGKARDADLPEDQINFFVTSATRAAISEMAPEAAGTPEEARARKKAMLILGFQGVSALFQMACPRSNRTARQIDKAKNITMQNVALQLLGDEIDSPAPENEQMIVDAGMLYAKLAGTQNRTIRDLDLSWATFISWTKFTRSMARLETKSLTKAYEDIARRQNAVAA